MLAILFIAGHIAVAVAAIRRVQVRVFVDGEAEHAGPATWGRWVDRMDDLHWQVQMERGWDEMTPAISRALMRHAPGGLSGEVQETHHYVNAKGWWKSTKYTFNFDEMTQTNPTSGKTRQIRLVAYDVVREAQAAG